MKSNPSPKNLECQIKNIIYCIFFILTYIISKDTVSNQENNFEFNRDGV
jgi:hypothetical protein